jgi:hypothetical protein
MRKFLSTCLLSLALVAPAGLMADQHEKDETYIYATYFYCNTAKEEKADDWVKNVSAPIWDAAVADGTVKGWGWMSHHTGGKWRRIQYHTAGSMAELLGAQESVGKKVDEAAGDTAGVAEVCGGHDDYIWKAEAGNATEGKRGKVGLSVYHVCDFAKEERADEIVKKVFAPVYDKAMADGKIVSWGWNSHVVGGKYRRLATMTADNLVALNDAWGEILEAIYGDGDNAEANEFSELCSSHSDYFWELTHVK